MRYAEGSEVVTYPPPATAGLQACVVGAGPDARPIICAKRAHLVSVPSLLRLEDEKVRTGELNPLDTATIIRTGGVIMTG